MEKQEMEMEMETEMEMEMESWNGKLKWKLLHDSGLDSPKLPLLVQDRS